HQEDWSSAQPGYTVRQLAIAITLAAALSELHAPIASVVASAVAKTLERDWYQPVVTTYTLVPGKSRSPLFGTVAHGGTASPTVTPSVIGQSPSTAPSTAVGTPVSVPTPTTPETATPSVAKESLEETVKRDLVELLSKLFRDSLDKILTEAKPTG